MVLFGLFLFFFSIFLPGYFLSSILMGAEKPFLWKLALSYTLGCFFISLQIFIGLFIFRLKFSLFLFYLILLFENIFLFWYACKNNLLSKIKFSFPAYKTREWVIYFLILILFCFSLFSVVSRPTAAFDATGWWSYRAKVLYYNKAIDFNPESILYLGGTSHKNYPWLVSIIQFWLDSSLGEFSDLLNNVIFFSFFAFSIIFVYYFLIKYLEKWQSLIFSFFLASSPLFFYHSYNGYADLVLSAYALICFIFLFLFFENNDIKYLYLSGIFGGISMWVKNEAIIFIIAALIVSSFYFFFKKINKKILFIFFILLIAVVFPWIIFMIYNGLSLNNVTPGFGFHPEIIKGAANSLFASNSWNIWWFIFILSFILNCKKILKCNALRFGWLFVFLVFGGFFLLYLFTNEYQFIVIDTAFSRNMLTLFPISAVLSGASFKNK